MRYLVNVFNAIVTVLWAVWVKLMLAFVGILAQLFINFKKTRIVVFPSNFGFFSVCRHYLYRQPMFLVKPRLPWSPVFGLRMLFMLIFGLKPFRDG